MKHRFITDDITYTGEQLHSNFAYTTFGIIGDSIISFCGKCNVKLKAMIDLEDLKAGKSIYSEMMLHFIIEHYETDLEKAVLRQLLFTCIVKDRMNELLEKDIIRRRGSDLFEGDAKLSISIATITPISSLIHFGINITSKNTPVKTKGLEDYSIDAVEFADSIMDRYVKEHKGIELARCKVRWTR
ncbi:MAG TPA: DUF366 family protein [candidate division WOR-3 bacterium]|uniref:DUF366 family protein n=1 Tax=candidate division WOR-3 bacterium TaxID=2052148 RepID=A0A9C9EME5_UNCW3|nr:DUF366 family protein [candidate division WOR-3 bacterium]